MYSVGSLDWLSTLVNEMSHLPTLSQVETEQQLLYMSGGCWPKSILSVHLRLMHSHSCTPWMLLSNRLPQLQPIWHCLSLSLVSGPHWHLYYWTVTAPPHNCSSPELIIINSISGAASHKTGMALRCVQAHVCQTKLIFTAFLQKCRNTKQNSSTISLRSLSVTTSKF